MHAHNEREHGSNGAHRLSTTRGFEGHGPEPVPKGSTMVVRRVRQPCERLSTSSAAAWQIQDKELASETIVPAAPTLDGVTDFFPTQRLLGRAWRCGGGWRRRRRRVGRIDPAGIDPAGEA